jgi:hypothetical protein
METAFAPYDGAHAEQSIPIARIHEQAIAEYDAARRATRHAAGNGNGNGEG